VCDGAISTTTPSGGLVFHIFSAIAEFERNLTREHTMAGLAAARARGRMGGRNPINPGDPRMKMAKALHNDKSMSVGEIYRTPKISKSTLYRYLSL
jgi:DNA invertase Pin-like site-specific DNA recombinase